MSLVKWAVLRLLWEARGHTMDAVAETLQEKWPGREGLSVSSIQRATRDPNEVAPEDVADFIRTRLEVRPNHEDSAEVVRLGLAAFERGPLVDTEALAASLTAKLPKVDPAVITAAFSATAAEVARMAAVEVLAQQPKPPDPKTVASWTVTELALALARAFAPWVCAGSFGGALLVGVIVLLFANCQRGQAPAAVSALPPAVNLNVNVGNVAAQVAGEISRGASAPDERVIHPADSAKKMGDRKPKPRVRMVPHKPMRGQATTPCPGSTSDLYGGCWYQTAHSAPCPPDQYQDGQSCYVPVNKEEDVPASETRELPHPEQR